MAEKPILFSAPMVRAILEGRKTVTRRIVKPRPSGHHWSLLHGYIGDYQHEGADLWHFAHRIPQNPIEDCDRQIRCPYGKPGDSLYVKEAAWMWCECLPNGTTGSGRPKWLYVPMRDAPVIYQADHPSKPGTPVASPDTGNLWGWRLKVARFLPRWASRITLEVTGVRVERLQDISENDCFAEGLQRMEQHVDARPTGKYLALNEWLGRKDARYWDAPRDAYRCLWESINGAGSWDENPHVWVVEFRRIDGDRRHG